MSSQIDPKRRDDFSKFLVHLTKDNEGIDAEDNLLSILKEKTIDARNPHCLFYHKLQQKKFSSKLSKMFNTVCLTETPLSQIKYICANIPNRKVKLKPFGLVFWKEILIDKGANAAIYINAKGTAVRDFLLYDFDQKFDNMRTYTKLAKSEKYCDQIIYYYSLINVIDSKMDFSWEREYRFPGNLSFGYSDIVAIIAEDPDRFSNRCENELPAKEYKYIKKIPIISPDWNYEEVIEAMSILIWNS